jgi:hypothetical protein
MDEALKKEVQPIYEQIGALVQASQQMEFSIGFSLTLLNQLNSRTLDDEKFDSSMDKFSKSTLGRLIGAIKKHINIDADSEQALKLALDERNYIIHSFFHDKTELFATSSGRKELLNRVQIARKNIDPGFKILDSITELLMQANGMSMEEIMKDVKSSIEY